MLLLLIKAGSSVKWGAVLNNWVGSLDVIGETVSDSLTLAREGSIFKI